MGRESTIEWCHATWNPLRGCSRVSEGCRHCYAEREAHRHSGPGGAYEGLTVLGNQGVRWTGIVRLIGEHLDDPIRWREPRRIFVNSMSDLFHEAVPDEWIRAVFGVMASAQHHRYIVLTKRPQRMRNLLLQWENEGLIMRSGYGVRLPNVCLGVSVEDQKTADERIPLLLQTPAAVRCVSYEPALGPVNFRRIVYDHVIAIDALTGDCGFPVPHAPTEAHLDWVIIGGESGPNARPFDIAWARSTVEQCRAAGVACFMKQFGARPYNGDEMQPTGRFRGSRSNGTRQLEMKAEVLKLRDRKGGDPTEWPQDLRIREFPGALLLERDKVPGT